VTRIPQIFCELSSADAAIAAARHLQARGFDKLEAYTPCQVPELEALLRRPRSRIPYCALAAGIFGLCFAYFVIWYCNAYDYPLDIGGRPLDSIPADIPIMFETAVLFAGLTTFSLVILRSGLPRLSHPLFSIDGFDRVSSDRYWLGIDTRDHDEKSVDAALAEIEGATIRRAQVAS
jgi:hypothetical protein